jgi:DNA-directed RNA polymerase subunit M/transcription elongation factor TFIIS
MEFCPVCNNMLYIKAAPLEEDELPAVIFHCKNCLFERRQQDREKCLCVSVTTQNDKNMYSIYMNPYLSYDPTIPRVDNIPCPNTACTKPSDKKQNVMYLKYDAVNMKYLYHCTYCQHFWTLQ